MPIIQQRRGTAAVLAASNETPLPGQIYFETDTNRVKIGKLDSQGNGITYNDLPYLNIPVATSDIAPNTIVENKIVDDAVTTAKIADSAVTNSKLADSAISVQKMQSNSVTTEKIENSAVTADKLATDSVIEAKIENDAVTTNKIVDSAVTNQKIAPSAVTADKIHNATVTAVKMANDSIAESSIQAGAVTNSKIGSSAVDTDKIANDAVTYAKMQDTTSGGCVLGRTGNYGSSAGGEIQEIALSDYARTYINQTSQAGVKNVLGFVEQTEIDAAIAALVGTAPIVLDTLGEIATSLNNDADLAGTLSTSIGTNTSNISTNTANIATNTGNIAANAANVSTALTNTSINANSINLMMPKSGGTFTGDVTIGTASGSAVDIILPRQSTTSKHQIRFLHSGVDGFSNPPNELDFIRLYTDSTAHAGLGISSGQFNIGTKGNIDVCIFADTSGTDPVTVYDASAGGEVTHSSDHNFGTNINIAGRIEVPRANSPGTPKIVSEYNGLVDTDTGIYFPAPDAMAVSVGGTRQLYIGATSVIVDSGAMYSPLFRAANDGTNTATAFGRSGDPDTGMYFPAPNEVALVAGADEIIKCSSSGITTNNVFTTSNAIKCTTGSTASCAIQHSSDGNTGIIWPSADNLGLVAGSVEFIRGTSSTTTINGTVTITDKLNVSNLHTSGATNGQVLKYSSTAWIAATPALNDNSDVTAFPSAGHVLYHNGTNWQSTASSTVVGNANLADLSNVSSTAPSTGEVLTWNGTSWAAAAAPTGGSGSGGSSTLAGLTDVTISSASTGEVLYWNGSGWVNQDLGLHAVATSGSYNDLTNKPTYSTVATSGSYTDLANIPSTFAPSTHVHPISAVTNLQTELNGKSNTGHGHAQSEITGLVSDLAGKASLVGGKVPASELPSFVDDVLEYNGTSSFPTTGETSKIYVDTSTNKTHRWSGSAYVEISASPGSTDDVTEGSTNLYFTNARADSRIGSFIINDGSLTANSTTSAASQASVKSYADNIYTTLLGTISSINTTLAAKADTSSLSAVATGGRYSDLTNIPSTFAPATHVQGISTITGLTSALAAKAETSSLSAVATSGNYSDISGRVDSLDDLSDVSAASPSAGDILRYNGSSWVKENPELISTINTTTSNRAISLDYSNAQSFVVNMQSSQLHTVSFANWPTTNPLRVLTATMIMKFPGTGGYATSATVQWPNSVKWPGGTAPTITNKTGAVDVFSFVSYDNGTSWLGFTGGQEF